MSSETLGRNLRLLMILLNVFTYIIPFFVFLFWQRGFFLKGYIFAKVPESFQKQGVPITKPPCQMGKRSLSRLCYKVYFEIKDDHSGLWNDGHLIARSMKSPNCGLHPSIGLTLFFTSLLNSIHKTARKCFTKSSHLCGKICSRHRVDGCSLKTMNFILLLGLKVRKCLGVRG